MTLIEKVRLRLLVIVVGIPLAAFATISLGPSWLATLPVVGVVVLAMARTLNTTSSKMAKPICWTCGGDLSTEPGGAMGVVCQECGSLNQQSSLQQHKQAEESERV